VTGLIGWWPLNENTGSTAYDLSGNGNHGSLNGGVTQGVAGKGGLTSYSFDGSDDRVDLGSLSKFSEYTFSWWARRHNPNDGDLHYHVDFRANNGAFGAGQGDGTFDWIHDDSEGTRYSLTAPIEQNEWIHWCAVWDGSKIKLFKNSSFVDSVSVSSINNTGISNDAIGYYSPGNPRRFFDGFLSDVRVYRRALSSEEIQTLYEWGNRDYARPLNNENSSSAVSRWAFDGNADDVWSGNDGSVSGASFVDDAIRGQALDFGGSSDYVSLNSHFSLSSEFTIGWWMRAEDYQDRSITGDSSESDSANGSKILLWDSPDPSEIFVRINTNGDYVSADIGLSSVKNKWVFICVRRLSNDDIEASLNGGSFQNLGNISGEFTQDLIGTNSNDQYFKGLLDEIRVYDKALSPSEVFELYRWGTRGRDLRKLTVNSRGL